MSRQTSSRVLPGTRCQESRSGKPPSPLKITRQAGVFDVQATPGLQECRPWRGLVWPPGGLPAANARHSSRKAVFESAYGRGDSGRLVRLCRELKRADKPSPGKGRQSCRPGCGPRPGRCLDAASTGFSMGTHPAGRTEGAHANAVQPGCGRGTGLGDKPAKPASFCFPWEPCLATQPLPGRCFLCNSMDSFRFRRNFLV